MVVVLPGNGHDIVTKFNYVTILLYEFNKNDKKLLPQRKLQLLLLCRGAYYAQYIHRNKVLTEACYFLGVNAARILRQKTRGGVCRYTLSLHTKGLDRGGHRAHGSNYNII